MHLDQSLSLFLNHHSFLPEMIISLCSFAGNIKVHLLGWLIIVLVKRLRLKFAKAELIFIQLICLFLILYLLKISILRVRPEFAGVEIIQPTLIQRLFDNRFHSFPSSHAALFGFYLFFCKNKKVWILPTLIMGLSRIVSSQHYFGDVLIGLLIGISANYLPQGFYAYLLEKIKKGQIKFALNQQGPKLKN